MKLFSIVILVSMLLFTGGASTKSEATVTIQANEIISKIEEGEPVNYSYVIVEGNLNISGNDVSVDGHIATPIEISDSIICGYVIFDGLTLEEATNFERTEFKKGASFIGTRFTGDANFQNSQFDGESHFTESEFGKLAYFQFTKFNEFSDFMGAKFKGQIDFHNSKFNKTAFFRHSEFDNEANFENILFADTANFRQSRFGIARFAGSRFNGPADFNFAEVNEFADFIGAEFRNKVYFNDITFSKLLISWDSVKDNLDFNGPTYLLLIKNFRNLEQFEDADDCYYQYRDKKRQDRSLGWAKALDYLAMVSCGYGVRWQNSLLAAIGTMFFFGIYFSLKGGILDSNEARKLQRLKESLIFSLTLLTSAPTDWYVNLFGYETYKNIVITNKYSIFLERVIGWSILIILINTLSRIMIRY